MLKIVRGYIHCQHGNRLRPCAELGGSLPTPVVSPACPCSYPCSCSWLSCLNTVINGYGMPGLYGRWWAGSARPQAWGYSDCAYPCGFVLALWHLCPCRSLPLPTMPLLLPTVTVLPVVPVTSMGRSTWSTWSTSMFPRVPVVHTGGPHGPHRRAPPAADKRKSRDVTRITPRQCPGTV